MKKNFEKTWTNIFTEEQKILVTELDQREMFQDHSAFPKLGILVKEHNSEVSMTVAEDF